jgi:hypothetical protein
VLMHSELAHSSHALGLVQVRCRPTPTGYGSSFALATIRTVVALPAGYDGYHVCVVDLMVRSLLRTPSRRLKY